MSPSLQLPVQYITPHWSNFNEHFVYISELRTESNPYKPIMYELECYVQNFSWEDHTG